MHARQHAAAAAELVGPHRCPWHIDEAMLGTQAVILDREQFPRDKYCGDAVCTPALRILEDMGVMAVLRDANECHYADAGGFVSPSGLSYIGACRSLTRHVLDRASAPCCARVFGHFTAAPLPRSQPCSCVSTGNIVLLSSVQVLGESSASSCEKKSLLPARS